MIIAITDTKEVVMHYISLEVGIKIARLLESYWMSGECVFLELNDVDDDIRNYIRNIR